MPHTNRSCPAAGVVSEITEKPTARKRCRSYPPFLGLHGDGVSLAYVFWGLWLFPFGVLVMRSGFLPRILGVLLIIDCFALVVVSLTGLLLPTYLDVVNRFAIIPELGELRIVAWLLIKGAKDQPLENPA